MRRRMCTPKPQISAAGLRKMAYFPRSNEDYHFQSETIHIHPLHTDFAFLSSPPESIGVLWRVFIQVFPKCPKIKTHCEACCVYK